MAYGKTTRRKSKRRSAENTKVLQELALLVHEIHNALPRVWANMAALQRENAALKATVKARKDAKRAVQEDAGKEEAALRIEREIREDEQASAMKELRAGNGAAVSSGEGMGGGQLGVRAVDHVNDVVGGVAAVLDPAGQQGVQGSGVVVK